MPEKPTDNLPVPQKKAFPLVIKKSGGRVAIPDNLRLYLREVNKFPLLEPEEEYALARRVRLENDQEAAFRLVTSHLRLVVRIAMDFQKRWMRNVLDLIQEGNVGLMKAVRKFDPEKGIKFSYYASFWIKAYILKFIMDNWRMVKIGTTQAQRKLFYNLNKERQRLESLGYTPTSEDISRNLNVTRDEVEEMGQRLSGQDASLDASIGPDEDGASRMDFLPAEQPGIGEQLARSEMESALHQQVELILPDLNEKEKDILQLRLLADEPVTLRELGEKYGITRERIRQIEARLLQKIKTQLTDNITDFSRDWIEDE